MTQVWQFADELLRRIIAIIMDIPVIFWVCMIGDLIGFVVGGIIWYGPQLMQSPLWAWPFIPDCPLAALLGMIAYLRLRAHQPADWFTVLASLACIKYGIWTVLFWSTKWAATGEFLPIEIGLVVVHLGMMTQGLLLWPALTSVAMPLRLIAVAWLAVSVVVDYRFGYHPYLVPQVTPMQAGTWAAVLTVVLGIAMVLLRDTSAQSMPLTR